MPTEQTTQDHAAATGPAPGTAGPDRGASEDRALRELAVRQVERVRSFKLHLLSFVGGVVALGGIWVLTEYLQDNTWPSRFADADDGDPGTWNPWFFWAAGIWAIVLGVHAVKTYARRPPTEAEIQREIDRISSSRR
jgi:hypothetical protein